MGVGFLKLLELGHAIAPSAISTPFSSAEVPTDRQAIKIAPPPPRFLFPFLRQSGMGFANSSFFCLLHLFSPISFFFFLLLCVFAAPFCASDRGRQKRSVQRSNVCLAGFFLKKITPPPLLFPAIFSPKVLLCIVLGNRRACPTFYFDAFRGPVLFLFFSFGRSHCLISVLRA